MSRLIRPHVPTLKKTASYYLLHVTVAAAVAWMVTGSIWMALTLSLLEPTVQAVAYFWHEKLWQRLQTRSATDRPAIAPMKPVST